MRYRPADSPRRVGLLWGGAYPDTYDGGLFFRDYGRGCLWVMRAGAGGQPDPGSIETFATELGAIVDLKVGPDSDLFYIDIAVGEVRRVSYGGGGPPAGE